MSPVNVSAIGAYIREQREQAKISLRQLAQSAGISNPYLSQIERGLRRPSADILQQIAKGLRISAEALYVQAGFLEDRPPGSVVREAVLTDDELTERQKQMLIEIYESFRKETVTARVSGVSGLIDDQSGLDPDEAALIWPNDRSPAVVAAPRRLAIAAQPDEHVAGRVHPAGVADPENDDAWGGPEHDEAESFRIWATGTAADLAGQDAAGEDDDEDGPAGPGGTIHQFPPPAGTR